MFGTIFTQRGICLMIICIISISQFRIVFKFDANHRLGEEVWGDIKNDDDDGILVDDEISTPTPRSSIISGTGISESNFTSSSSRTGTATYTYTFKEEDILWIQKQRKAALNLSDREDPLQLHYRAMAGLGHQLMRLAGAYHLSKMYRIPRLYMTANPMCGGDIYTIYKHLIGAGPIIVDLPFTNKFDYEAGINLPSGARGFPNLTLTTDKLSDAEANSYTRAPSIVNNIPGYRTLWFRNEYIPRTPSYDSFNQYADELFDRDFGKTATDYEVYQQVMLLFKEKHNDKIQEVLNATRFNDHTVFALHVRTGNGEKGDFKEKDRGYDDLDKWLQNIVILLCKYSSTNAKYFTEKPLMIFVGTDTGSVVPKLQFYSSIICKIPIVSAAQKYPEEGKSVSFLKKHRGGNKERNCLESWESMFLDMYLFTQSNSVIAGAYSSFTQSAPLSYIFEKAKHNKHPGNGDGDRHPHYFCDAGTAGDYMDCYDNVRGWLKFEHVSSLKIANAKINRTLSMSRRRVEILHPCLVGSIVNEIRKLFAGTVLK